MREQCLQPAAAYSEGHSTETLHAAYCSPATKEVLYFTPRARAPTAARHRKDRLGFLKRQDKLDCF